MQVAFALLGALLLAGCATEAPRPSVELADLTWLEAERLLTPDTIVVLPIGAAAKEHGPHLTLENDFLIAEYFKERVLERCDVVVAPTLNYHHYPTLTEYPGSTTLRLETARDVVVDVVRSLAAFGPRRFFVLNTGVSTVRALAPAAEELAKDGLLLRYTDLLKRLEPLVEEIIEQERGSHADELETSMMLVIAPETVDMSKAVDDAHPRGTGGLSRDPSSKKTYSPTGVWGNATLATRAKGERIVAFLAETYVQEIEELRTQALPGRMSAP